jgi:hypothetical protein
MAFGILRKIKYALFILFVIVLVAVFYLTSAGLPRAAVLKIEPYLQFSGMVLSMDKIKLSIFEGIVATKVKYYKKGDIGEPVLQAEKVVILLEPLAWLTGGRGVSGVIVKNGRAQFALGEESISSSGKLALDGIYAHVLLDDQSRLRITSFATSLAGLKVSGRGVLVIPRETAIEKDGRKLEAGAGTNAPNFRNILDRINAFTSANTVSLDTDFYIDPDNIGKLSVKANVHGRNTVYDGLAVGAWNVNIAVTGKSAQATIALKEAELGKIWVQSANGLLQFDGKETISLSLKSMVGKGVYDGPLAMQGKYNLVSEQYAGHVTSGCDLRAFVPLLKDLKLKLGDIFADFDFKRSLPSAEVDFAGGLKPAFLCRIWGEVLTDTLNYKRVPCLLVKTGFDAVLDDNGEKVTIKPLLIVRDEGLARGQLVYDSYDEVINFSALSMADPKAICAMIDPAIAEAVTPFAFEGLCYVTAFGTVGLQSSAPNDMEFNFNANDVRWKMFTLAQSALTLRIVERTYRFDDINAAIYHGVINGAASIDPIAGSSNMLFSLSAKADNIDFGVLVNALAGKQVESAYEGLCSASINLHGLLDDPGGKSMQGEGWLKIDNGRIFTVPIFSGLFDMVGKVIPGLGNFNGKNNARATIKVEQGKASTRDIFVEGDVFSLKGSGDVYFDGRLDFKVQITFMRQKSLIGNVVQILALPLTKALEFRLTGNVSDPKWESAYLPF